MIHRPTATAALLLPLVLLLVPTDRGEGQETLTQQEALRLAFPAPARIERRTAYLSDEALERASRLAAPGVEIDRAVVTYYVGRAGDSALGVAYFDAHVVRTLREVLMVVVEPGGRIGRIEVLSFDEPRQYRPPEGWLDEFGGLALSDRLSTKGEVVNVTGATLTSRAVTRAARRVLALHRVVNPLGEGAGSGEGDAAGGSPPADERGRR